MNRPHPKTATCLFRTSDYYRRDEFCRGLRRHGFVLADKHLRDPAPEDVLLIWNRNRNVEDVAARYERAGARVIVAENGYLGQPPGGGKFYALALGHHNGGGSWFVGDGVRFDIPEQPWRARGDHILLLPQRGIGSPGVRMPNGWLGGVTKRLAAVTGRPVRVRLHPGHKKLDPAPDFVDCHAAVTWGSGAGIKALQAGIPVFHEFERWIGGVAGSRLGGDVESCNMPDRAELWRRVSWAQWALDEISSGEAFDRLLHADDRDLLRTV